MDIDLFKKIGVILLLVMAIILIQYWARYLSNKYESFDTQVNKPYLWTYWENKPGMKTPEYISLCLKIMQENGGKYFRPIILDELTVLNYLPMLREDINKLSLAQKSDYIRVKLLVEYGGVWLDADTIVISDLYDVYDFLINKGEDFVGYGCTGVQCDNGYGKPSNGAMASQRYGKLMSMCLKELDRKLDLLFSDSDQQLDQLGYFDLGKHIIWDQLDILIREGYTYHHFLSNVDGSRDKNKYWVAPQLIFEDDILLLDEEKLQLVFLSNSYYCGTNPRYNWFCKLSEKEILSKNYYISRLFRKALINNR